MTKDQLIKLFNSLEDAQTEILLKVGRRVIPNLTPEDILQPNDYLDLECHPEFRFEEGVLIGIRSAKAALLAEAS